MDYLVSPQSRVVLNLKEGNGFAFLTAKIIAVATLKGIKLETKEFQPSARPNFNSEFIWEINTKYLRKLRTSNTALKLEFYSPPNNVERTQVQNRIGYVLLNLKEAQIVIGGGTNVLESWHRLLNLKNVAQTHKPEVLLKFEIIDSPPMNFTQAEVHREDSSSDGCVDLGQGDIADVIRTPPTDKPKSLQIGPPHLCTESYELSITLFSLDNLEHVISMNKIGTPIRIQYAIFGLLVWTDDLSSLQGGMHTERTTFEIWSKIEFLTAYFKEFETLILTVYCGDDIFGVGHLNLQHLSNISARKTAEINSLITVKPATDSEDNIEILPALHIGVNLVHKSDFIVTKLDQECQTLSLNPIKRVDAVTNTESPALEPVPSKSERFTPHDHINTKENSFPLEEVESEHILTRCPKMTEKVGTPPRVQKIPFAEQTEFVLRSPPHTFRLSNASTSHVPDYSKEYIRDAALKACEELEDWKEKQQEMFEYELKRKSERKLKKLSNEWLKHKQALEDDLNTKIKECQTLKEKLISALHDLNHRTELVTEKEHELELAKEELDRKYSQKFQELRKASKLHEYDMEDRINEVKSENIELLRKLEESAKEILRLQQALLHQDTPKLSKEEANNLFSEMRVLEQKLEKALESKAFFKEQWGKAVRELHKMKEQEQLQLKLQIQRNQQELQTLGLVKEISQEVGEMKKDQSVIKNIRSDLSNFISSSDPVGDSNYLSGT